MDHTLLKTLSSFSLGTLHHTLLWVSQSNLLLLPGTPNTKNKIAQGSGFTVPSLCRVVPLNPNHFHSFKYNQYTKDVLISVSSLDFFSESALYPTSSLTFSLGLVSISTLTYWKWNSWTPPGSLNLLTLLLLTTYSIYIKA